MFIDDTGDVEDAATADPKRRYASISGVIFEWDYYHHVFEPAFRELSLKHFGLNSKGNARCLRRHDIMNKLGPFSVLADPERCAAWDEDIFALYTEAPFTVITSAVDKIAFYYKHPKWRGDMYLMLVQNAVERYYYFLKANESEGDVVAEELNRKKDRALSARYRRIVENGFQQHTGADLQRHLTSLEMKIRPKPDNVCGLQIADLLAAICFHHCHRIYGKGRGPRNFSAKVATLIEESKFYRHAVTGDPHGFGRIWRPK